MALEKAPGKARGKAPGKVKGTKQSVAWSSA